MGVKRKRGRPSRDDAEIRPAAGDKLLPQTFGGGEDFVAMRFSRGRVRIANLSVVNVQSGESQAGRLVDHLHETQRPFIGRDARPAESGVDVEIDVDFGGRPDAAATLAEMRRFRKAVIDKI